ncbi:MAG: DNA-directed RNA polymerase subunit omega [Lactobacillales bacterium]|jgi:DNA-directed RNA polymerase subunit omega|nr:DNA-directed RNA polymerase subunit omega [Lactobacillales bacterium]
MILEPSIDELLSKIKSKYSLVILASKRSHELQEGEASTVKFKSVKNVGKALEEIAAEKVFSHPDPEKKREQVRREKELRLAAARHKEEQVEKERMKKIAEQAKKEKNERKV